MKKLITTVALLSAFALAAPVFAQTDVKDDAQNVESDANAVNKDNSALSKDQATLQKNRDAKAADKANGNYGKQAVDSVKIGADQTAIGEKKAEKSVDKKILTHHQKELNEDADDSMNK